MKSKQASVISLFLLHLGNNHRERTLSQLWKQAVITVAITSLLWGCSNSPAKRASLHDDSREVKMALLLDVSATLLSDKKISNDIKTDISKQLIQPLGKSSYVQVKGEDRNTRPVAVNFQKVFEQTLVDLVDDGKVSSVTAVIHTPMPATPLCNPAGKSIAATMHPDIRKDPARIKTIEDRTLTTRRMASHGDDIRLYIAYPKDGLSKRSPAEQHTYHNELQNKNNSSLVDTPLTCSEIPSPLIGASYLIITPEHQQLFFSLTGTQAKEGTGITDWQVWFGELSNAELSKRHDEVTNLLKQCGQNIKL